MEARIDARPHKPLLVLYALGRIERGEDRLIPYREVDEDLRGLLIDFGPPRKSHHPEYPFWRLQNDGISLCVLHHKLFDWGALHITADYRIRVSEYVDGLGPPGERLLDLDGEKAEPPQDPSYRADEEYIEWREEEVFRAVEDG